MMFRGTEFDDNMLLKDFVVELERRINNGEMKRWQNFGTFISLSLTNIIQQNVCLLIMWNWKGIYFVIKPRRRG